MGAFKDYGKNGGLPTRLLKEIKDALADGKNLYHTSMIIICAENGDTQAKLTEIEKAFNDQHHPLHLYFRIEFARHELEEVARNYDEMSLEDLIKKHGETAVKWGAMQNYNNNYREKAKEYGKSGGKKRHAEDLLIKNEIIRLYQANKKLTELSATTVAKRITKPLIHFLKENKFKKTGFSDRSIAKCINEFRKSNKTKK